MFLPQAYVSLPAHVLRSRAGHLEQIGLQLGGSLLSGWGARTVKTQGSGGLGLEMEEGPAKADGTTAEGCGEGPS